MESMEKLGTPSICNFLSVYGNGNADYTRLGVTMNSYGIGGGNVSPTSHTVSGNNSNVMLDCGTTLTILYPSLIRQILTDTDGIEDGGYFFTYCSLMDSGATLNFDLGGKVLRVPFTDFLEDFGHPTYCRMLMDYTTDQQILGDSVLRAGYFIFDWDNQNVHIAQASNCGTEVVDIGAGVDSVPSVTGKCDAPVLPTASVSARPTTSARRTSAPARSTAT
jgi:hypothetical protein